MGYAARTSPAKGVRNRALARPRVPEAGQTQKKFVRVPVSPFAARKESIERDVLEITELDV